MATIFQPMTKEASKLWVELGLKVGRIVTESLVSPSFITFNDCRGYLRSRVDDGHTERDETGSVEADMVAHGLEPDMEAVRNHVMGFEASDPHGLMSQVAVEKRGLGPSHGVGFGLVIEYGSRELFRSADFRSFREGLEVIRDLVDGTDYMFTACQGIFILQKIAGNPEIPTEAR